jgi:peptidoglycan/LPS O-acetylase OafA/YrhL
MSDFNPYAPPAADSTVTSRGSVSHDGPGLWRERSLLVMDKTATLPVDRCIVCHEPATGRPLRRKLSWHSPWWYLLVLFNLVVYAIAAMIVRRKVDLRVGLCDLHRTRRRRSIALAWTLIVVAFFLLGYVALNPVTDAPMAALMALALLSLLVGGLVAVYGPRVVTAKQIDDRYAWIGGVSSKLLDTLPDWSGPKYHG